VVCERHFSSLAVYTVSVIGYAFSVSPSSRPAALCAGDVPNITHPSLGSLNVRQEESEQDLTHSFRTPQSLS